MEKTTIMERINTIAFDGMTREDFDFLVERAKKSVKKYNPNTPRKPSKKTLENGEMRKQVIAFLQEQDEPTAKSVIAEKFGITESKVSALLAKLDGIERTIKKDGKNQTTFYSVK